MQLKISFPFVSFLEIGTEPEVTKMPTTPEEGGFGSVHICASVPYPTSMYSTFPRNQRAQQQATTSQVSN